ncbi:MAG TPA: RIP metalloprotease RseP, partial [Gemmatimonadales bacterium]|nr:RIP metalloprotease RseP [Gemmatimonadales bacterium]
IHELGHFLAAKWAGIHVFRFSVGMGAPIRRLTWVRGGTEYSISWLPLGGYVKMASQEEMAGDVLEGERPDVEVPVSATFEAQPVWKRMVVILAGVTFNVLFAWIAFSGMLYKNGRPVNPTTTVGRVVDTALPPEGAALGSLRPGDRLVAINGQPVASWEEVTQGLQQASGDSIRVDVAGREPIVLPIHHDALEERIRVSLALLPALPPVLGRIVAGGAAASAGLRSGDTVLSVNGSPVAQWYDLVEVLEVSAERPVQLELGRDAGRTELTVTPEATSVPVPGGGSRTIGRIGVWPAGIENRFVPISLGEALGDGAALTLSTSTFIVRSVRGMLTGRISTREVGGPIAISQEAAASAREGLDAFIMFMALISVNLAVVNLLPIPVLDGGQFLFLLGEAVIRRPLPARLRQRLTTVGLLLIGLLMVLAFSNDIRRLFGI